MKLLVQITALSVRVGAIHRLHRQLAHALQHVGLLNHRPFSGLHHVDAVVEVAHGLVQTLDLRGHVLANRQPSGIVLGRVDTRAGGELFHGRAHGTRIGLQRVLCVQGADVGVDH